MEPHTRSQQITEVSLEVTELLWRDRVSITDSHDARRISYESVGGGDQLAAAAHCDALECLLSEQFGVPQAWGYVVTGDPSLHAGTQIVARNGNEYSLFELLHRLCATFK
jgi:hypothetical protein